MTTDRRGSTRDRLLDATTLLIRTKGAAASGTKEILELANAPRGSFYFHFPEGKDQLVREAVQRAAAVTLQALQEALVDDDGDLATQITSIFEAVAAELLTEDYARGCAVGVTTLESSTTSTSLRQAVDEAFTTWTSLLHKRFSERGVPADRAAALAATIVATLEGATMLARAHRDPTPLRHTAEILEIAVNEVLAARSHPKSARRRP